MLKVRPSRFESTVWRPEQVAAIVTSARSTIPLVAGPVEAPLAGLDLWDMWPAQLADGNTASFAGATLWFVLSAPRLPDPDLRHGIARIRLVLERDGGWVDCGNALPDGLNPGSREWAGSALFDPATGRMTLFYTVAGYPGEAQTTFAQRLFQTTGQLDWTGPVPQITGWSEPTESVVADQVDYMRVTQAEGVPGFIKGFRDPAHFRDPADGASYLLFTGSLQQASSDWNGCIGLARATSEQAGGWELLPPLITADGLNNEQERPHVLFHAGAYYLFWSTQRKVFAPGGPSGPNGLYGMVADRLTGPYRPLNGTGLVAANPDQAPFQTYSWWVDADLAVHGFVDLIDTDGSKMEDRAEWRRAHFGGCPAPRFHLRLDGQRAWVEGAGHE
ncbi:MAG: glycoside hydrolase family 68 protein [Proteobacteria bacterium]|nr:glycoside hydrolase family 68 protein [Pseudomonadota bacterium]